MGLTSGVTVSAFSDFGDHHHITDIDGEPVETLAVDNIEVVECGPRTRSFFVSHAFFFVVAYVFAIYTADYKRVFISIRIFDVIYRV